MIVGASAHFQAKLPIHLSLGHLTQQSMHFLMVQSLLPSSQTNCQGSHVTEAVNLGKILVELGTHLALLVPSVQQLYLAYDMLCMLSAPAQPSET